MTVVATGTSQWLWWPQAPLSDCGGHRHLSVTAVATGTSQWPWWPQAPFSDCSGHRHLSATAVATGTSQWLRWPQAPLSDCSSHRYLSVATGTSQWPWWPQAPLSDCSGHSHLWVTVVATATSLLWLLPSQLYNYLTFVCNTPQKCWYHGNHCRVFHSNEYFFTCVGSLSYQLAVVYNLQSINNQRSLSD